VYLVHCLLSSFIFQCGFNPLYFAENQWVKTTLEDSKTQRNLLNNVLSTLFIKFLSVFDIYFQMNRPKNDANTYCF